MIETTTKTTATISKNNFEKAWKKWEEAKANNELTNVSSTPLPLIPKNKVGDNQ